MVAPMRPEAQESPIFRATFLLPDSRWEGGKKENEREREKRRKKAISLITVEEHEVEAQLHNENATAKSQSPIGRALYREFLAKFRDEWQSSLQLFRCHTEALCAFDWQYSLSMKLSDWTRQTRDTQQRCD